MARLLTMSRFKALAREHKTAARRMPAIDAVVRKQLLSSAEMVEDRVLRFTISTAAVDREGDTIAVDGWDLTAYRQNPVVLWCHDSWDYPIGRAIEIGVVGEALKATVQFVPADVPCAGERAEAVLQLCRGGFLNATSVGFKPREYAMSEDPARDTGFLPGFDFTAQELLEFSIVAIPANPQALIDPGQQDAEIADSGPSETVSPNGAGTEAGPLDQARSAAVLARREGNLRAARVRRLIAGG